MKSFYTRLLRLIDRLYPVFFAFLALMTAFLCFRCLGIKAIDSWDEARHGISAYEMLKNGNFLVNTYLNEPDYWNVKPPVSFWSIMAGFTLFGYTSVGLRFFSALAYLITTVVTGLFARRYGKLTSLLVMAFLCANYFPFKAHLVRAGDADSLYLLFFTLAMLAMLKIRENGRMLYVCGLCFSLAFLTKSFHAGMIAAIGGLFLLLTGELRKMKPGRFLLFLGSALLPAALWAVCRFQHDGFTFFRNMYEADIAGRTAAGGLEGHGFPFSFYWTSIFWNFDYIYGWLTLLVIMGLICLWIRPFRVKDFPLSNTDLTGLLLWFLVPFLGFSAVSTKLMWYVYPCACWPLFFWVPFSRTKNCPGLFSASVCAWPLSELDGLFGTITWTTSAVPETTTCRPLSWNSLTGTGFAPAQPFISMPMTPSSMQIQPNGSRTCSSSA